jgi:hypothetical protein
MIGERAGYSGPFSLGGERRCFKDRQVPAADEMPWGNFGPDLGEVP